MTLKLYKVQINGIEHLMQLNENDAKRYGDKAKAYTGKGTPKVEEPPADQKKPPAAQPPADPDKK